VDDLTHFTVVYSKRKTVSIEVTINGALIVRAPFFISYDEIQRIVLKHKKWIKEKLSYAKDLPYTSKNRFISGEYFWYLGSTYKLNIVDKQNKHLVFKNNEFYLNGDVKDRAKDIFVDWYKKETLKIVQEKANFYAAECGVSFKGIRVTSAEKRWGSCSINNSINFSYRVAMTPVFVIDYIIVHELCHIKEHNHSKSFWNHVINIMPDYKIAKEWLRDNGYALHI